MHAEKLHNISRGDQGTHRTLSSENAACRLLASSNLALADSYHSPNKVSRLQIRTVTPFKARLKKQRKVIYHNRYQADRRSLWREHTDIQSSWIQETVRKRASIHIYLGLLVLRYVFLENIFF